jgi:hypothetical protein
MDAYPLFINGQISEPGIDPPARIVVVMPSCSTWTAWCVCPQKMRSGIVLPGVRKAPAETFGDMRSQRVFSRSISRDRLALEIQLLQLQIERRAQPAEPDCSPESHRTDGHESRCGAGRQIARCNLINPHAHQVRHDVGEPVVVIAFHPHHFNIALGIR